MESRAPRSREERNRQAALYQANLIQQQKDTELRNLEYLEKLIDFPTSPNADPITPSTEDAVLLKEALRLFQPSDYDNLIQERNINRSCGYALCPRPNKLLKTSAQRFIVRDHGKASDPLKSVDKKALERWCSDACGKRALYLKVQLNEKPAWERGGSGDGISLLDESNDHRCHGEALSHLTAELGNLRVESGEDKMMAAMRNLAIERGDGKAGSLGSRSVDINVKENIRRTGSSPLAPQFDDDNTTSQHNVIEGYRPHTAPKNEQGTPADEDDSGDDDENDLSNLLHYR